MYEREATPNPMIRFRLVERKLNWRLPIWDSCDFGNIDIGFCGSKIGPAIRSGITITVGKIYAKTVSA